MIFIDKVMNLKRMGLEMLVVKDLHRPRVNVKGTLVSDLLASDLDGKVICKES